MIKLFGAQFLSYALICAAYRAVNQANYLHLAILDFSIASLGFFVIRKVVTTPSSTGTWLAYAVGGVCGSLTGTFLSATFLTGQ